MAVKKLILADRAAGTVRAILEDGTESVLSVEGLTPEAKVIQLSDVKRAGDGRFDFAALSESAHSIAPEVFRAMTVQQELDAAVKEGKVTPAERPMIEKIALSDLATFREFVKTRKPQVALGEAGFSGSGDPADAKAVDSQIVRLADEKCKADKGLQFDQAVDLVLSEHPDLKTRTLRR